MGCGPSLRRIQQSRVYFERCYAADFDPRVPLVEKQACWAAWQEHYTIGQPEDRTEYASERLDALRHGESVPHLPGLPAAALGPRSETQMTASSEETLIPVEEDPATAAVPRRRSRRERHPDPVPRTSNAICAVAACEAEWRGCLDDCPARSAPCETACEIELQACARGCF